MAFDENLAARIRKNLARKKGIEEKKKFGGIIFMLHGNMLVGVWKDSLIVRLGDEQGEEALLELHVRPFDITGKPMKGWVLVNPAGIEDADQLKAWIQRAVKFVGKLPGLGPDARHDPALRHGGKGNAGPVEPETAACRSGSVPACPQREAATSSDGRS